MQTKILKKFSNVSFVTARFRMLYFVQVVQSFVVEIASKSGWLNKDNNVLTVAVICQLTDSLTVGLLKKSPQQSTHSTSHHLNQLGTVRCLMVTYWEMETKFAKITDNALTTFARPAKHQSALNVLCLAALIRTINSRDCRKFTRNTVKSSRKKQLVLKNG